MLRRRGPAWNRCSVPSWPLSSTSFHFFHVGFPAEKSGSAVVGAIAHWRQGTDGTIRSCVVLGNIKELLIRHSFDQNRIAEGPRKFLVYELTLDGLPSA